ncbi:glycosyltransferase family 2 protein [Oceanicella sp. SM1341]|uniref:glycosyltransferase n=1 Tax=Oceanicella sp. SM1341 TaxID=1548889 RepID=UPI0018E56CDA|nr:glycosyltransferase [Oceanicella sp. SM1341]
MSRPAGPAPGAASTALARARVAVVVPARNEEARIAACLAALSRQRLPGGALPAVFVIANDCTDATVPLARALAGPGQRVVACTAGTGGVGRARNIGLEVARECCPELRLLLTTDADCITAPGWAAALADALTRAPAACGAILPAAEPLTPVSHPDPLELRYALLTRRFHLLLGRHAPGEAHDMDIGGANMGFRVAELSALGGFPELPSGEDRALAARFRQAGHRVLRVPEARVHASCRSDGRAPGGMAEGIRARLSGAQAPFDSALRPFAQMLGEGEATALGLRLTAREAGRSLPALEACVARLSALGSAEERREHVRRLAAGQAGLPAMAGPHGGMQLPSGLPGTMRAARR